MSNGNDNTNPVMGNLDPVVVIGPDDLRQIEIAGDIFGGELVKHVENLLTSPIFRQKVIDVVNKVVNIPILGEGTEAIIFGQAYDWVVVAIIAVLRKID